MAEPATASTPQDNGQGPPAAAPAPKQAWESLSLRARPAPVTRLNRKVIGVLLAGGIALVAYALHTGMRPPQPVPTHGETPLQAQPGVAEGLRKMPRGYGELPRPPDATPEAPPAPAPPPMAALPPPPKPASQPPAPTGPSPEALAAAEAKRKALEEAQKARMSDLFFPPSGGTRSAAAHERLPPMMAGVPPVSAAPGEPSLMDKYFAPQAEKRQFLTAAGRARKTVLPHQVQDPLSPYEVKAGTLIPAVLLTGINADLPGQLIAQVREPVYDTVTGRYLLIPQGTRILGTYDSAVVAGQNRVLVVWTRLLFPDGASLSLDGMPGVDLAGYAGFKDRVNNHYGKLLGSVVLSSLLGIGARLPFGSVEAHRVFPTLGQEFAEHAASGVNRAGQSIVSQQLAQQPTIEIRPGFAVNVFVNADLVLRPYPGAVGPTPTGGGRP